MSQENNNQNINLPQETEKQNEKESYFLKIVTIRLYHRKKVKKFLLYIFIAQSIYFIFGIILFLAAYLTRYFVVDPDDFWEQMMNRPSLLILQKFCAGSGIYTCCFSLFSIMDSIVIYVLINKGGLKRRLLYGTYILLVCEIINFLSSLYSVLYFRNIIFLFPIYFVYSCGMFGLTIYFSLLIKNCSKNENLFLFSIDKLNKYMEEIEKIKNENPDKKKD